MFFSPECLTVLPALIEADIFQKIHLFFLYLTLTEALFEIHSHPWYTYTVHILGSHVKTLREYSVWENSLGSHSLIPTILSFLGSTYTFSLLPFAFVGVSLE